MPTVAREPNATAVMGRTRNLGQERAERAWRATNQFRIMLPNLEGFVRALTRNPTIRVQITKGTPCTDGKVMFLRAPIELGDMHEHQRSLCGQRDPETLAHLCKAHAVHEQIMATLIHECAHIIYGTFEDLTDTDRAALVTRVLHERPSINSTRLGKLQELVPTTSSYMQVCHMISPYLPTIFNALEDARVNRAMYTARAGAEVWFRAKAIRVFEDGIERDDGTIHRWDAMGRNSQVIIGLFCRASGFTTRGWLKPEVEDALADHQLRVLLARITTARSAASVYKAGFPILERLRELGFCRRLGEPADDPAPPPPPPVQSPPPQSESSDEGEEPDDSGSGEEGDGGEGGSEPNIPEEDDDAPSPSPERDDDDQADDDQADDDQADDDEAPADGADDDLGASHDDDDEPTDDDDDDDEPTDDDDEPTDDDDDDEIEVDLGGGDDEEMVAISAPGGDQASSGGVPEDDDDEDPDDAEAALQLFGGHGPVAPTWEDKLDEEAINRALVQGEDFDSPSNTVLGINVHRYETMSPRAESLGWYRNEQENETRWDTPEAILGRSLLAMRIAFAANRASRKQSGLRHGRVHGPDAFRAVLGDNKVFARTKVPGRRRYAVTCGLDVSGSTCGRTLDDIKQAAMAMSDLMSRTGVDFSLYAHTGYFDNIDRGGVPLLMVDQFELKSYQEPWAMSQRTALRRLTGGGNNLDGHSLEFYRKLTERQTATDKLIIYFTDGAMPAANRADETEVLKREIETCHRLGISLLGVGIGTDSPTRHGLDTVRIDSVADIPKLVAEIETRLTRSHVG